QRRNRLRSRSLIRLSHSVRHAPSLRFECLSCRILPMTLDTAQIHPDYLHPRLAPSSSQGNCLLAKLFLLFLPYLSLLHHLTKRQFVAIMDLSGICSGNSLSLRSLKIDLEETDLCSNRAVPKRNSHGRPGRLP